MTHSVLFESLSHKYDPYFILITISVLFHLIITTITGMFMSMAISFESRI